MGVNDVIDAVQRLGWVINLEKYPGGFLCGPFQQEAQVKNRQLQIR
jgi:hypothetical protein